MNTAAQLEQIIKGKPVADHLLERLSTEIAALNEKGFDPKVVVVRVGERPDHIAYKRNALRKCESVGLAAESRIFPENISQDALVAEIQNINQDKSIHAVLLLMPLPSHLDSKAITHALSPRKDMDCLTPVNVSKLMEGETSGFYPCTPLAVIEVLKFYNVPLAGKKAAVLGRSMVVGKPVAMLLLAENATVTICHSKTENLPEVARQADILVVAIGQARFVKENFVKPGAVVIDVGINVDDAGNLIGDVDFDACAPCASMITPVPGGVGTVTLATLIRNVVKACKMQNRLA